MKKSKLTFLIISSILFLFAAFLLLKKVATGGLEKELIPSFTEPQSHWIDIHGPYIKTSWKQDSAYAAFTPDNVIYHALIPKLGDEVTLNILIKLK
jgi:hypothetical protein